MTTDIAVLESAIVAMAVFMGIQTLLLVVGAVVAYIAWRRASQSLTEVRAAAEAQAQELRIYLNRMTATVDETARALRHGTAAVEDVISDARDAVGTVRNSVGTVASVVSARRAAVAVGIWKGYQVWRSRREEQRLERERLEAQALPTEGSAVTEAVS